MELPDFYEKTSKLVKQQMAYDDDLVMLPDDKLIENLGIDSLDAVQIAIAMEDELHTPVDESRIASAKTFAELVAFYEELWRFRNA